MGAATTVMQQVKVFGFDEHFLAIEQPAYAGLPGFTALVLAVFAGLGVMRLIICGSS